MDDRTLWLIRHAKSDWSEPGSRDFDRPLNARGLRDGPRMARWLATQADPATWIWTSDALRARTTAEFVLEGFRAVSPTLVADHRLYLADPDQLLDVLRETPPNVRSVALVAHNPGLTELVNLLGARPRLDNLPTLGIAAFRVTGPWPDLVPGACALLDLMSPKRLPGHPG